MLILPKMLHRGKMGNFHVFRTPTVRLILLLAWGNNNALQLQTFLDTHMYLFIIISAVESFFQANENMPVPDSAADGPPAE